MKRPFQIGDWVKWHSKTKGRWMSGQIADLYPHKAMILWTTWDGREHHWFKPYSRLRKVALS